MVEGVTGGSRRVLITGGARGIGKAIANRFSQDGDDLILIDRESTELRKTGEQLQAEIHVVDVGDFVAVQRVAAEIEAAGAVDVLINNAGIMYRQPIIETSEEDWDAVFNTNTKGVFNWSRALGGAMASRNRGWIVNVGSIWATHAWPDRAVYAASKAAVEQFTRCFALELAPHGVRVNAIAPGMMTSAMTAGVAEDPAFRADFLPRVALGEIGDPEQHLADLVLFLVSPGAAYMTGEVVRVLGGYY